MSREYILVIVEDETAATFEGKCWHEGRLVAGPTCATLDAATHALVQRLNDARRRTRVGAGDVP